MHFDCAGSHKTGVTLLVCGILPVIFCIIKMVLVFCPCAFRLRRLTQNGCHALGLRHFTCKFLHKMVLVFCPCAFRLRRLTQNGCHALGLRHFTCKFLHKMVLVFCPCAFRLRRLTQTGCHALGLRHFTCKFLQCISTAQAHTKRVSRSWSAAFYL